MPETAEQKASYGKRPLWQWILIYVVIGGVLYFLIYKFVIARSGGGINYSATSSTTQTTPGY